MNEPTREQIQSLIGSNDVVLFMKGHRGEPQCGFSATVIRILDTLVPEYQTFDVLSDAEVRDGIKEFSSWPTIPQLYVRGEFLGGCDIIQELYETGELHDKLGVAASAGGAPSVNVTDGAAEAIRHALEGVPPDHALHLGIDARYQASLFLGPRAEREVEVESNGITLRMDALSANRAEGAVIDGQHTADGPAFRVSLPNAPAPG